MDRQANISWALNMLCHDARYVQRGMQAVKDEADRLRSKPACPVGRITIATVKHMAETSRDALV